MAEVMILDALQAFHRELVALRSGFGDATESLNNELLVQTFEKELEKLWECPAKNDKSRNVVKSGKLSIEEQEFTINEKFQQDALLLSDELDLDEIEAAKCLLESQDDPSVLGRSLLECGIIRFHQQRKYTLDALRLLLELDSTEDDAEESRALETIKMFVTARLFQSRPGGCKRYVPCCMAAMGKIKSWLQRLADKIAAAQALSQVKPDQLSEEVETIEFSRVSLIQQHELLGVVLCRLVENRQADVSDFMDFVSTLKKLDKYDNLLGWYKPSTSMNGIF
ncbi:hypothetical protein J3458_008838 [Metarhizium acridum]|uniref:uncharacterized protein n=1 Tax=Metarhizium acridum TaxID=92637 RepID=UPI001C6C5C57|nr:hypothetical protein J3458_008838 [Metarhizium acridum]